MSENTTANHAGTELSESDLEAVSGGTQWPQIQQLPFSLSSSRHESGMQTNLSLQQIEQMVNQQTAQGKSQLSQTSAQVATKAAQAQSKVSAAEAQDSALSAQAQAGFSQLKHP